MATPKNPKKLKLKKAIDLLHECGIDAFRLIYLIRSKDEDQIIAVCGGESEDVIFLESTYLESIESLSDLEEDEESDILDPTDIDKYGFTQEDYFDEND